jgi:flagellar basal-body rod protein FlgF
MQEVLAISLHAMHDDMQRLDRISMNMANATTPGYKREIVASQGLAVSRPGFASMMGQMNAASTAAPPLAGTVSSAATLGLDNRPGTLRSTGESLDVALSGPGYFEVSTDKGPAYTRQGNFRLDARGRLVTAQGYPVMGRGGEIYLNGGHPVIDGTGNVYENAKAAQAAANGQLAIHGGVADTQAVAQLKVVAFDQPQHVQRLGDGLMAVDGDSTSSLKDSDIQVRQGYLENSNVSTMREMVDLMQTMRHFESMQKVAMGYDDITGQAIRKLGDLS